MKRFLIDYIFTISFFTLTLLYFILIELLDINNALYIFLIMFIFGFKTFKSKWKTGVKFSLKQKLLVYIQIGIIISELGALTISIYDKSFEIKIIPFIILNLLLLILTTIFIYEYNTKKTLG
jgi:sulfite exporter TauE/SafE